VSDATILLRDIAGDAATKAADKVNPHEDDLAQIDRPAEDNTWHENPDMSKDNIRNQVKSRVPFGKKEVMNAKNEGLANAHPDGSTDPRDHADLVANDAQNNNTSGLDAVQGAKTAVNTLKDQSDTNGTATDAKNRTKEYNARTQNYLKGKMPKERREQTIWRLKKMVVEIQGHADCMYKQIAPASLH